MWEERVCEVCWAVRSIRSDVLGSRTTPLCCSVCVLCVWSVDLKLAILQANYYTVLSVLKDRDCDRVCHSSNASKESIGRMEIMRDGETAWQRISFRTLFIELEVMNGSVELSVWIRTVCCVAVECLQAIRGTVLRTRYVKSHSRTSSNRLLYIR